MAFNELFDETLDINSTANYKLSIQVSLDGFYFSLLDILRNKFVLYRSYEPADDSQFSFDDISKVLREDDFLGRSFSSVIISAPSPKATIIPAALYDPAGRNDYLSLNSEIGKSEVVRLNRLTYPDAYLIFSVNSDIAAVMAGSFPAAEPVHHLKPLLYNLLLANIAQSEAALHLHVEKSFINMVCLDGNKVKLCNTFEYRSISDLLYYVLFVADKAGVVPGKSTITTSGATTRFDEIWTSVTGHFRSVKYSRPHVKALFSYVFNEELLHRHLNLFTLNDCA